MSSTTSQTFVLEILIQVLYKIFSVTFKVLGWNYVPKSLNPADLPSRRCLIERLVSKKWWEGPEWLREARGKWPRSDITLIRVVLILKEKKSYCST